MVKLCESCNTNKAMIKRPRNFKAVCQQCFFTQFEDQVHQTIIKCNLFKQGDKIAIGTSGGKDSTVVAHLLNKLNKRHKYGVDFYMLAIDQGIKGYRDDSLQAVKRNQKTQDLPLMILGYKDLYGWTMDEIVSVIGRKNNCTYCGVFRRQALERGAVKLGCNKIITGHNADDIAETVLMNMLRGDLNRLGGCANAISGQEGDQQLSLPRVKPLKYAYEKEIVLYAYHKKLDYFSTQCIYSPFAYRGHVRELIKELESKRPQAILDIIYSAEEIKIQEKSKPINKQNCESCGFMTSNKICKACILLEGLNKSKPKVKLGMNNQ